MMSAIPATRGNPMLVWRRGDATMLRQHRLGGTPPVKLFARLVIAFTALAVAAAASAQTYPDRPVKVVVGFAAGGPTDVIARIVADKLSARFGKQFYVVNQPGAGSNTATGMVATSPPDGYTLLVVSTGFVVNPSLFSKVPYDPVKDFSPISMVAVSPNVISVHPSVPAKTMKELIEVIKANPGKYSFAAPGVGSTPHLSGEIFRIANDLDLPTVQFTGAAPAIQATVGGHTPIAFSALPPAAPQIQQGLLRGLAVTAEKRSAALPEVPTMAEAGIQGQEAYTLTGILAPAGTPSVIIDQLHQEILTLVALPEVQKRLDDLGFQVVANSPHEFAARIKTEMEKWAQVIRDAKIKPQDAK
jgi:tripartite-type tricarboxylate transporter receptor subunit TctC